MSHAVPTGSTHRERRVIRIIPLIAELDIARNMRQTGDDLVPRRLSTFEKFDFGREFRHRRGIGRLRNGERRGIGSGSGLAGKHRRQAQQSNERFHSFLF